MSARSYPPVSSADVAETSAAAAADDPHARRHLSERDGRLTYSIAYRGSGDRATAEECMQDAPSAHWRRADHVIVRRSQVSSWLFAIARELALGALRRQPRAVELAHDRERTTTVGPDELVMAAERLGLPLGTVEGRVRLALERLRLLVPAEAAVNR